MDQRASSMDGVRGPKDIASSAFMEDPRSLQIVVVGGDGGEEEQPIRQIGSMDNEIPNETTAGGDGHATDGAEGGVPATSLGDREQAILSSSILRLNAPSANHDVACDRGEEEQQIPHVGAVEIEVPNEDVVDKYAEMAPKVGMTFDCEKKTYEMYNNYAGLVGFSVRKSRTKRRKSDDSLSQKYFVCSGQGLRKNEASQKDITRTCCDARVQFSISKENVWTVQKIVVEHNHYLASPNKIHKLRSQREIIEADRKLIGQARRSGMKLSQVFNFMKEHYGGEDKVPFTKMDCYNEIGRERRQYLKWDL